MFIHHIIAKLARLWGSPRDQVLVAWPPLLLPEPDALLFPQAMAMDALSLEQQLPYAFFTQAGSQQSTPPQPQPPPPPPPASQKQPPPQPPQVPIVSLPPSSPLMPSSSLTRGPQLPPLAVTVPSSLPQSPSDNPGQPPMGIDITSVSPGLGPWGLAVGLCRRSLGLWETTLGAQGPKIVGHPAASAATSRLHLEANLPGFGAKADAAGGWAPNGVSAWNSQAKNVTPCTHGETEAQTGVSAPNFT